MGSVNILIVSRMQIFKLVNLDIFWDDSIVARVTSTAMWWPGPCSKFKAWRNVPGSMGILWGGFIRTSARFFEYAECVACDSLLRGDQFWLNGGTSPQCTTKSLMWFFVYYWSIYKCKFLLTVFWLLNSAFPGLS